MVFRNAFFALFVIFVVLWWTAWLAMLFVIVWLGELSITAATGCQEPGAFFALMIVPNGIITAILAWRGSCVEAANKEYYFNLWQKEFHEQNNSGGSS